MLCLRRVRTVLEIEEEDSANVHDRSCQGLESAKIESNHYKVSIVLVNDE